MKRAFAAFVVSAVLLAGSATAWAGEQTVNLNVSITGCVTRRCLSNAVASLCAMDPDLDGIVARFGNPPLWARYPGFATLVRIILEQQVSNRRRIRPRKSYGKFLTVCIAGHLKSYQRLPTTNWTSHRCHHIGYSTRRWVRFSGVPGTRCCMPVRSGC